MSEQRQPVDLQMLWQRQPTSRRIIPLQEIKQKALGFHRTIFWRNVWEYTTAALLLVACISGALVSRDPMARLGHVLLALGCLYIACQLHWRAAAHRVDAAAPAEAYLVTYKAELARQIAALRGIWHWYLLPLQPGLLVLALSGTLRRSLFGGLIIAGALLAVPCMVWRLNWRTAQRLQRELDALSKPDC